ncbi:MAG: hypothetical protein M3164_07450 [Actinomycetota bacterium]|nr:hypothetical protein [Actinomycetota bacterium]
MTQKRKAEAEDVQQWDETVAAANELDELRTWVVWGSGAAPPPDMRESVTDDEVAAGFAKAADPEWEEVPPEERWVAMITADEDDVDALVAETNSARGFTPYLMPDRIVRAPETIVDMPEE